MSLSRPIITFDRIDKPYLPGETVTVTVVILNKEVRNARAVLIRWRGKSFTWGINSSDCYCQKDHFRGFEIVWISMDGKHQMPIGYHTFKFSITLPVDIPPTFRGGNGRNNYKVKVEIDCPWKFNIKETKEIMVTHNLNIDSKWISTGYYFRCSFNSAPFFSTGPISLKVVVPNLVFTAGQYVELRFEIINDSATHIQEIFTRFGKQTHYHARNQLAPCQSFCFDNCPVPLNGQKNTRAYIGEGKIVKCHVAPHSIESFVMGFEIPTAATSPSFHTGLITYGYFMSFGVVTKWFFQPSMRATVYIGATPGDDVEIEETKRKVEKMEQVETIAEASPPPSYDDCLKNCT